MPMTYTQLVPSKLVTARNAHVQQFRVWCRRMVGPPWAFGSPLYRSGPFASLNPAPKP